MVDEVAEGAFEGEGFGAKEGSAGTARRRKEWCRSGEGKKRTRVSALLSMLAASMLHFLLQEADFIGDDLGMEERLGFDGHGIREKGKSAGCLRRQPTARVQGPADQSPPSAQRQGWNEGER